MSSRPDKNMDSIGRGLLDDKQKYRTPKSEDVELKDMSKKYNYVNFDDQGIQPVNVDEHVVRMTKPSDERQQQQQQPPVQRVTANPQGGYPRQQQAPIERPPSYQQQTAQFGGDYPSFEYQPIPMANNLPVYRSEIKGQGAPQPPQQPSSQPPANNQDGQPAPNPPYPSSYQPYPQYQSQYAQQCYQSYGCSYNYGYNPNCSPVYPGLNRSMFGYERPIYYNAGSQVYIPGVSHGQLRPAYQSNVNPNQPPVMINRSRISLNGMQFDSSVPVNRQQQQPPNPISNNQPDQRNDPRQPNQSTFQSRAPQPQDNRVVVPDMLVTCHYCNCAQNIPGDSSLYICYQCQRRVKCFPTHSIFRCTQCNKRVCYQLGTSHLIKCGYCKTINEVPVSHEESLNLSMINASRIEPSKEEEKQQEPPTKKPSTKKEAEAEPLLQPTVQYPSINSEDGFDELSDIIHKTEEPDARPAHP